MAKKDLRKREKNIYLILNFLLIAGMLIALFLLYEHFSATASEFCKFGKSFDCGIVNKSPYANLDGISYLLTIDFKLPLPLINVSGMGFLFDLLTSNAFLGFLTLLFLFGLLASFRRGRDFLWIQQRNALRWAKGVLIFGVAYGFYLFLIQHFLLKTYCFFCLLLDAILILSLVFVWRLGK